MGILKRHWPVMAAVAVLLVTVAILYAVALEQNGHRLVYALDDTYIHMSMARNLAQNGVWGITAGEFSSSSSSPLWTLMLAGVYLLTGPNELAPLLLNVVAAIGVLALVYAILRRHVPDRPLATLVILLVMLFFTPLPALIFAGMEHTVQVLLSIAFLYLAAVILTGPAAESSTRPSRRPEAWLVCLAMLLTMIRYEGLFLVAVVGLLMLLRRRFGLALLTAIAAWLPIAVYGAISIGHGWYFFPNSIILKAQTTNLFTLSGLGQYLITGSDDATLKIPRVFCLLGLGMVAWLFRSSRAQGLWRLHTVMIITLAATTLLHIQFAKVGWFYRYEAYLVGMFVLILSLSILEDLSQRQLRLNWDLVRRYKLVSLVAAVAILPVVARAAIAARNTPLAMNDRYLEHIAMAEFVHSYYDDSVIVVNDVGAVSWYTHARMLDMFGLASREPVIFRRQPDGYGRDDLRDWAAARSARIAILMTMWSEVSPRIPKEWEQVGQWQLARNVVFGDFKVGFFAIDPQASDELAANLKSFGGNVTIKTK
jgi:hypothetical protein